METKKTTLFPTSPAELYENQTRFVCKKKVHIEYPQESKQIRLDQFEDTITKINYWALSIKANEDLVLDKIILKVSGAGMEIKEMVEQKLKRELEDLGVDL